MSIKHYYNRQSLDRPDRYVCPDCGRDVIIKLENPETGKLSYTVITEGDGTTPHQFSSLRGLELTVAIRTREASC